MSLAQLLDEFPPVRMPSEASAKLSGFRAWVSADDFPEKWRVSFLNGAIHFEMSPEEPETHNKVKGGVQYTVLGLTRKMRSGTVYFDGVQYRIRQPTFLLVPF